jgi:hypothetical protein
MIKRRNSNSVPKGNPEAMKPRRIAINGEPASNVHQLDGKAA